MASLTLPPALPTLRQGYGDATAGSHVSVQIMDAARRKREAEEAEAARKAAREDEQARRAEEASIRADKAQALAEEQNAREAEAAKLKQQELVTKRAPDDITREVAGWDEVPEVAGKPFAQLPRYAKQTMIERYGSAAPQGWDEAQRQYTGETELGRPKAPTPGPGETISIGPNGEVTRTIKPEDFVSPKEAALEGIPPTLDAAERTKKMAEYRLAQRKAEGTLTPAEKAVDTKYAADFVDWETGGKADVEKSITQLGQAQETLGKENVSGPIIGLTPDWFLSMVNEPAMNTRQAVEEVVQRNLRAVLGGQFAQREGELLIKRAYNPSASEEENAKRLGRLMNQIAAAAAAKDAAAAYYRQNGTLKGWTGKMPTISDFEPTATAGTPTGSPKTGTEIIERGGKRYEVNHDTKAVRELK